jgi:hypothetical protein
MNDVFILSIAKAMSMYQTVDGRISLCVHPIAFGCYGVYANAVLIAIHADQATADGHCQRLCRQQALDEAP